jgi:hypothetical protein
MNILKIPESNFTETDSAKSVENARQIKILESEWPEIQGKYKEAGKDVATAQDRLDGLQKQRAFPEDIANAKKDLQRAIWTQEGILSKYRKRIQVLKEQNERLTLPLRQDAKNRWIDELRDLPGLRTVRTIERQYNPMNQKRSVTLESNAGALEQAKTLLVDGLRRIDGLQFSSIPEIQAYIDAVEAKLRAIDLAKLERLENLTPRAAEELQPETDAGPSQKGTLIDGKLYIHPSATDPGRLSELSNRISKLEKGS